MSKLSNSVRIACSHGKLEPIRAKSFNPQTGAHLCQVLDALVASQVDLIQVEWSGLLYSHALGFLC